MVLSDLYSCSAWKVNIGLELVSSELEGFCWSARYLGSSLSRTILHSVKFSYIGYVLVDSRNSFFEICYWFSPNRAVLLESAEPIRLLILSIILDSHFFCSSGRFRLKLFALFRTNFRRFFALISLLHRFAPKGIRNLILPLAGDPRWGSEQSCCPHLLLKTLIPPSSSFRFPLIPCRHSYNGSLLSLLSYIPLTRASPGSPCRNLSNLLFKSRASLFRVVSLTAFYSTFNSPLSSSYTSLDCTMSLTLEPNRPHPLSALTGSRQHSHPIDFDKVLDEQAKKGLKEAYEAVGKEMIQEVKEAKHYVEILNGSIKAIFERAQENGDDLNALGDWAEGYREVFLRSNRTRWTFNQIKWDLRDILNAVESGNKVNACTLETWNELYRWPLPYRWRRQRGIERRFRSRSIINLQTR